MKLIILEIRARDQFRMFFDFYIKFDTTNLTYKQQDYMWYTTYKTITKRLL
jgi:hypothetical protein